MKADSRSFEPLTTAAELAAAIRRARKAQSLTLEQPSGPSGLGVRVLSGLERGNPTAQLGRAL